MLRQLMLYPQKNFRFIRPVHVHLKTDKLDYLGSPSQRFFFSFFSYKTALGSGIGTSSVFCLSFSFSNSVFGLPKLEIHNNFCLTAVLFVAFSVGSISMLDGVLFRIVGSFVISGIWQSKFSNLTVLSFQKSRAVFMDF